MPKCFGARAGMAKQAQEFAWHIDARRHVHRTRHTAALRHAGASARTPARDCALFGMGERPESRRRASTGPYSSGPCRHIQDRQWRQWACWRQGASPPHSRQLEKDPRRARHCGHGAEVKCSSACAAAAMRMLRRKHAHSSEVHQARAARAWMMQPPRRIHGHGYGPAECPAACAS